MLGEISELFGPALSSPPSVDRRAARRFADLWTQAGRGQFPAWDEIRKHDLGEDWNWAFVVDLKLSNGFPYFVYLGPHLAKLSEIYLAGDADWTMSLLDRATGHIDACVAAEGPHFSDDELVLCNGRRLLFRSVSAPLADDGLVITHVAGVANGMLLD